MIRMEENERKETTHGADIRRLRREEGSNGNKFKSNNNSF
jgi:hypothetical protein